MKSRIAEILGGFAILVWLLPTSHLAFGGEAPRIRPAKRAPMRRGSALDHFHHPFHHFSGSVSRDISISQTIQHSPTPTPRDQKSSVKLTKKTYVPPRWIESAFGVLILEPGHWSETDFTPVP
ncbi:MAG: hypothetical protein ACE5HC_01600 [Candidatus Binatia bacterium]